MTLANYISILFAFFIALLLGFNVGARQLLEEVKEYKAEIKRLKERNNQLSDERAVRTGKVFFCHFCPFKETGPIEES